MAIQNLHLVRPNLGSPFIFKPEQLKNFLLTFAYCKTSEMKEGEVAYPTNSIIFSQLKADPPAIFCRGKAFQLEVVSVVNYNRHPSFEANYGSGRHAYSSREQQYYNGFRWEIGAVVALSDSKITELKNTATWPALLDLTYDNRTSKNALFIHDTLAQSSDFTILHITDTHIAQRNDTIPQILSLTRNKKECELLAAAYINFNDNLRSFIRIANDRFRAESGRVIVVLTGDIVDFYFDGYWNGKFICGQGEQDAPDRRKEATGSAWGYSNFSKFREIILGTDGKGEPLLCPLFTVPGNHDYLMNEVLLDLNIYFDILGYKYKLAERNTHSAFGLSADQGREYDFDAFPRNNGKRRTVAERKNFRENIKHSDWKADMDQDWSYWIAKPKSWQLSQYLCQLSYDLDFVVKLGDHQLLLLNTGEDCYPRWEEFAEVESKEDVDQDYVDGGPHNRGLTSGHINFLKQALQSAPEFGLILIFSHAPLLSLQNDETKGLNVLFESNHQQTSFPQNEISIWLSDLYKKTQNELWKNGFSLTKTPYFKTGKRDPLLNFSSADGEVVKFLDLMNRLKGTEARIPILAFSGHTHKVHEFRIEKVRNTSSPDESNFSYFIDDYSRKYFYYTTNGLGLGFRYYWVKKNTPFLFTSGGVKNKKPQYREIVVKGQNLVSLEMSDIEQTDVSSRYIPGCRAIALRACNGQYVTAERLRSANGEIAATERSIGTWETFEIIDLLTSNKVALKTYNGLFIRAEGGGGGKLKADHTSIGSHETFELIKKGTNKVALRVSNGKYVCAEGGGGKELLANRDQAQEWETFELIELEQPASTMQVSPGHGTVLTHPTRRTTLRWMPVVGAQIYRLEVEYKSGNSWKPLLLVNTAVSCLTFEFIGAQPGRWRVSTIDVLGKEGVKTGWWEFSYAQ